MGDRVPFYGLLRMFAAAAGLASGLTLAQSAPFMIVGNDEKRLWDDQFNPLLSPPGRDSVVIVDLADPMNPRIVANLPLKNSVVGPPVNLAIDPSGSIALVADSIDVIKDGESLQAGARRQGPRHRPQGRSAQGHRHGHGREAAVGAEHQSGRHPGPRRQSRGQVDQRALDQGHRGQADRHHRNGRQRRARQPSRPMANAPWRSNFRRTRCHCSRSPATRSPTGSWTCRPGCGHSMWRWPPAARSP